MSSNVETWPLRGMLVAVWRFWLAGMWPASCPNCCVVPVGAERALIVVLPPAEREVHPHPMAVPGHGRPGLTIRPRSPGTVSRP